MRPNFSATASANTTVGLFSDVAFHEMCLIAGVVDFLFNLGGKIFIDNSDNDPHTIIRKNLAIPAPIPDAAPVIIAVLPAMPQSLLRSITTTTPYT